MRKLVYLFIGILVLSTTTACAPPLEPQPLPTEQPESRPSQKTVTDEWTQKQIPVKLFSLQGFPFTTYFPESDFIVDSGASDEGLGVWFYSQVGGKKNELAYVHFFFPAKPTTLEAMKKEVTGKRGLMETNKWTVKGRSQDIPYRWAKERIDFERPLNAQNNIMGTVYIGEHNGKAFRVTEHFTADYGDGFAPRSSILLKELQLKD
ncbi:MAG: hypothetical protein AB1589_05830 [Cyanobacteriota bacterium]